MSQAQENNDALGIGLDLLTPSEDGTMLNPADLSVHLDPSLLPVVGSLTDMAPLDVDISLPPVQMDGNPVENILSTVTALPDSAQDTLHSTLLALDSLGGIADGGGAGGGGLPVDTGLLGHAVENILGGGAPASGSSGGDAGHHAAPDPVAALPVPAIVPPPVTGLLGALGLHHH